MALTLRLTDEQEQKLNYIQQFTNNKTYSKTITHLINYYYELLKSKD